ncbi:MULTISPECIES: hypothetical protein [Xanthobacter]|uniref:Uncharacterized protein n=1 Tax=Xanthobacter aminoxidans TaxID=186280 RepID=A0ABW6ZM20_9HYPH|nr:hypothetical protein [Xanthobacter sp. 91]
MQDPKEAREDVEFHRTDGRTVDGAPVKTAAKARQGVTSGRMLMVLSVGLALVVIGFAASYMGAV